FVAGLPPPTSTLFPYTTLFRSTDHRRRLSSDGCLIDQGSPRNNISVTRDEIPGLDKDQVAWLEIGRCNGLVVCREPGRIDSFRGDRKSTRLNSSHVKISYAVFC